MAAKMLVFAALAAVACAAPNASSAKALTSDLPAVPVGLVHHGDDSLEKQTRAEHVLEAAIAAETGAAAGKFLGARGALSSGVGKPSNPREGSASDSDLSTTQAMEAAMMDLMLGNSALSATPMGGSIRKIQSIITKTMMPKVKAAHRNDQTMLRKLAGEVAKCGTTKRVEFRAAKGSFAKYRSNSRLHKKCRADEAIRFTSQRSCFADQKMKYKLKVLRCKAFATASLKYGTTKNNVDIVQKSGSESIESYVKRLSVTFCGRHVHGSTGKISKKGGWGGGLENGFMDKYLHSKEACRSATKEYVKMVKTCKRKKHAYNVRKAQCNQYQEIMDGASCKRAVTLKDACESYATCYYAKVKNYKIAEGKVRFQERDRKAEWRGLKRMGCLISSFADGRVTNAEVNACKKKTVSTGFLSIDYPKVVKLAKCVVPKLFPATPAYKRAEFAPLPMLAKGKAPAECSGAVRISTTPAARSPGACKCTRVTLNGAYSAGAMVKCTNCRDVSRSYQGSSCPRGTKIFAPASREDWRTFLASAKPVRAPHWIVDVTRPQNGCGGCTSSPMNSGNSRQKTWTTQDGAPWWLRSTRYSEPNGDYSANCFLDLWRVPRNENSITFNDGRCNYHSKSYYCQTIKRSVKPKAGSPSSCKCTFVDLTGKYSAGALIKCEQCTTVYRSTQKNSCPEGMKLFSPASRSDWRTFLKSAGPLRAPHWIVDITRPQNGCGGCTRYAMRSGQPQQATWRTSDRTPWWLRDSRYNEPNGDYTANCFMDLWRTPASENNIQFNDGRCNYRSRSYYCQQDMRAFKELPKPRAKARPAPERRVHPKRSLRKGFVETVYFFRQGGRIPSLRGRTANLIRTVSTVNYPNTGGSFRGLGRRDHFAITWVGYVLIREAGTYTFRLTSDDGSMLSIDGRRLVNNDGLHGARDRYGSRKLIKGQHNFNAVMFERTGGANMLVRYKGPDTRGSYRYVPGVHALTKGFKEQAYYLGGLRRVPSFRGRRASHMRVVSQVNYRNTGGTWPGFRRSNNFAVRWVGFLRCVRLGTYRFWLGSDDGSKLWINGRFTVNNDGLHGFRGRSSNYRMRKSKNSIRLEFFERGGHAGMHFRYMGRDTNNRMVTVSSRFMQVAY